MKLSFDENQTQTVSPIHLLNSVRIILLCPHQKHLGIVLDSKLNFNRHIDKKNKKCNKLKGLI